MRPMSWRRLAMECSGHRFSSKCRSSASIRSMALSTGFEMQMVDMEGSFREWVRESTTCKTSRRRRALAAAGVERELGWAHIAGIPALDREFLMVRDGVTDQEIDARDEAGRQVIDVEEQQLVVRSRDLAKSAGFMYPADDAGE